MHFGHSLRNVGCGAANGVKVNGGRFLAAFQGLCAHAALADHAFDIKVFHHVGLIRLFTNGGGGTCRYKFVFFCIQARDHRSAVINDRAVQYFFQLFVHLQIIALRDADLFDEGVYQPFMNGIASGDHHAREGNRIANF